MCLRPTVRMLYLHRRAVSRRVSLTRVVHRLAVRTLLRRAWAGLRSDISYYLVSQQQLQHSDRGPSAPLHRLREQLPPALCACCKVPRHTLAILIAFPYANLSLRHLGPTSDPNVTCNLKDIQAGSNLRRACHAFASRARVSVVRTPRTRITSTCTTGLYGTWLGL